MFLSECVQPHDEFCANTERTDVVFSILGHRVKVVQLCSMIHSSDSVQETLLDLESYHVAFLLSIDAHFFYSKLIRISATLYFFLSFLFLYYIGISKTVYYRRT